MVRFVEKAEEQRVQATFCSIFLRWLVHLTFSGIHTFKKGTLSSSSPWFLENPRELLSGLMVQKKGLGFRA